MSEKRVDIIRSVLLIRDRFFTEPIRRSRPQGFPQSPPASHEPRWPADPRVLLTVLVTGGTLFALVAAYLTVAGSSNRWDEALDAALRSFRAPALDAAMLGATYLCSWQVVVAGLVAGLVWLFLAGQRLGAMALLVSVVGDQMIVSTLKAFFGRARPNQLQALLPATGPSFPSGHTFAAIAFYGALALLAADQISARSIRRALAVTAVLFILSVGLSRVYLGAHWPSDVVGSCLLGAAWVAFVALGLGWARSLHPRVDGTGASPGAGRAALLIFLAWLTFVITFGLAQPLLNKSESIALAHGGTLQEGRPDRELWRG